MTTDKDRIICSNCGKEKDASREYYTSHSPFHSYTGRMHVCKTCFLNFINDDIEKLKSALRMIDKPFLVDVLKSSKEEVDKNNKNLIRIYMKNVVMPQYKNFTWEDSDFTNDTIKDIAREDDAVFEEDEITNEEYRELVRFFGKGFEKDDYIWLGSEYEEFLNRYECDSKGLELLIKEICLQQLDIKNRRAKGEKVDTQLKTLQDLLGSSNLKPVQETGANAVEQESFGTLIKKFEREKPIPEPDAAWKDVDGIGKYIKTFFFGHMARALGLENKNQDEYDEEIARYTVVQDENEDGENND